MRIVFAVLIDLFIEFLTYLVAGIGERLGGAFGKYLIKRIRRWKRDRRQKNV